MLSSVFFIFSSTDFWMDLMSTPCKFRPYHSMRRPIMSSRTQADLDVGIHLAQFDVSICCWEVFSSLCLRLIKNRTKISL